MFIGRRRNIFLNVYLAKFWKDKQSVGCANGIEGVGREGEMYFSVN